MDAGSDRRTPRRWLLRHHLEFALLRLVEFGLRALPVESGAALMGGVWRFAGPLTRRQKRVSLNLANALPGLGEAERRRISAEQWDNLGRTFAEALMIDKLVTDPARVELSISAELEARLRQPGGQVFVSMHSGNWELAALPARRFRPVAGIYQRMSNPLSDRHIRALRERVFDGGVFPKGADTLRRVTKWVRDGNAIAMLADQRESRGIPVTLFGLPALANPFPAILARRLGAVLVAARCIRLPGSRFRVEAVEVPLADGEDAQATTQALQNQFETWIRERPGEWMWTQDRWRPEPPGRRALRMLPPRLQARDEMSKFGR